MGKAKPIAKPIAKPRAVKSEVPPLPDPEQTTIRVDVLIRDRILKHAVRHRETLNAILSRVLDIAEGKGNGHARD